MEYFLSILYMHKQPFNHLKWIYKIWCKSRASRRGTAHKVYAYILLYLNLLHSFGKNFTVRERFFLLSTLSFLLYLIYCSLSLSLSSTFFSVFLLLSRYLFSLSLFCSLSTQLFSPTISFSLLVAQEFRVCLIEAAPSGLLLCKFLSGPLCVRVYA